MRRAAAGNFDIIWIDRGVDPVNAPNPAFPLGVDMDLSGNAAEKCFATLPYPAARCGNYLVTCRICRTNALVSTAGRPDDPRSVTLACRRMATA